MTQVQAPAKPPEAELGPSRPPARNAKPADAAPRGLAQGAHAVPTGEAVLPTAVAPAANATAVGQAASSVDAEKVAAPLQAESEAAAEVPDAPPAPTPAGPTTGAAHTAPAHSAAPVRATSETVANLTAQISQKVEGHSSKFDIELNPAGLGRVSVSVEIAASGKMTAAMSFDSPQAAAELRARSSEIQRALEQVGFDLSGGLSFDVADRGDGRGAPQQQQNDETAWRGRAFQALLDTTGEAAETASSLALNYGRRPNTGVDVRI
jgi:flagellar hook-length control protein FliK